MWCSWNGGDPLYSFVSLLGVALIQAFEIFQKDNFSPLSSGSSSLLLDSNEHDACVKWVHALYSRYADGKTQYLANPVVPTCVSKFDGTYEDARRRIVSWAGALNNNIEDVLKQMPAEGNEKTAPGIIKVYFFNDKKVCHVYPTKGARGIVQKNRALKNEFGKETATASTALDHLRQENKPRFWGYDVQFSSDLIKMDKFESHRNSSGKWKCGACERLLNCRFAAAEHLVIHNAKMPVVWFDRKDVDLDVAVKRLVELSRCGALSTAMSFEEMMKAIKRKTLYYADTVVACPATGQVISAMGNKNSKWMVCRSCRTQCADKEEAKKHMSDKHFGRELVALEHAAPCPRVESVANALAKRTSEAITLSGGAMQAVTVDQAEAQSTTNRTHELPQTSPRTTLPLVVNSERRVAQTDDRRTGEEGQRGYQKRRHDDDMELALAQPPSKKGEALLRTRISHAQPAPTTSPLANSGPRAAETERTSFLRSAEHSQRTAPPSEPQLEQRVTTSWLPPPTTTLRHTTTPSPSGVTTCSDNMERRKSLIYTVMPREEPSTATPTPTHLRVRYVNPPRLTWVDDSVVKQRVATLPPSEHQHRGSTSRR